jgi:hypothetical protein
MATGFCVGFTFDFVLTVGSGSDGAATAAAAVIAVVLERKTLPMARPVCTRAH